MKYILGYPEMFSSISSIQKYRLSQIFCQSALVLIMANCWSHTWGQREAEDSFIWQWVLLAPLQRIQRLPGPTGPFSITEETLCESCSCWQEHCQTWCLCLFSYFFHLPPPPAFASTPCSSASIRLGSNIGPASDLFLCRAAWCVRWLTWVPES